jgi:hypothetical protein
MLFFGTYLEHVCAYNSKPLDGTNEYLKMLKHLLCNC